MYRSPDSVSKICESRRLCAAPSTHFTQTYDSPNVSVEGFDGSSCIALLDMALASAPLDVVAQQGEGDQKPQVRKSDHIGGNSIPALQMKVIEISY